MEPPFVQLAPANPADAPTALSTEQVRSWQTQRYTLVDGPFPTALIDELPAWAAAHFPERRGVTASSERLPQPIYGRVQLQTADCLRARQGRIPTI